MDNKNKKPEITQQTSIVRTKKQGPIHVVYIGQKHIGNIVQPIIGGSKKRVRHFLAISRELKKKSSHLNKKDAMTWLTKRPSLSTQMESPDTDAMSMKLHTHEYVHKNGHSGAISHQEWSDGTHDYSSHPSHNIKLVTPSRVVSHSTMEKAHRRMVGLGYTHTGETTIENVTNSEFKIIGEDMSYSNMKPHEIHDYFHNLYNTHLKTGMAPTHFKSPIHLATIEEKNKKLPKNSLTKHLVGEGMESKMAGETSHSRQEFDADRRAMRIIKKKPQDALKFPANLDKVSEAFYKVYNKAKNESLSDKDKNKKDPVVGTPPKENPETGDIEVEVKKTLTGQPGDVIAINPKMNTRIRGQTIFQKPENKKGYTAP